MRPRRTGGGSPRSVRIVAYAVNGAGVGHLTRLSGILRWVRRYAQVLGVRAEIWFLTSSEAEGLLFHERFAAFKLPSKTVVEDAGLDKLAYLALAKQWVWHSLGLLRPDLLVVDTFPRGAFGELLGALDLVAHRAFVYRPVKAEVAERADFQAMLPLYDRVVIPEPEGTPVSLPDGVEPVFTGPIAVRDPVELLSRAEARRRLGLPADGPAVLVSAGGGGDALVSAQLDVALEAVRGLPVVVAAGPLYRGVPRREGVIWLTQGGLMELLPAFDVAVAAAGYNTFHELMLAGVPAVFLPQPKIADDQEGRARRAVAAGAAQICPLDAAAIRASVEALLADPGASDAARRLVPRSGARHAAQELLRLVLPEADVDRAAEALDDAVLGVPGLPFVIDLAHTLDPEDPIASKGCIDAALTLLSAADALYVPRPLLLRLARELSKRLSGTPAERADAFQRFLRAAAPFHDWGAAQTFARLLLVDRGAPWLEGYARALDAAAAQGQGLHDVVRRLSALLAAPEPPATNAALMVAL